MLSDFLTGRAPIRRLAVLFAVLANLFLVALIISYGASGLGELRAAIRGGKPLEATVSGEGKISAKPDIAKVSASIVVEREPLPEAQAEAGRRQEALLVALRGQGITDRDLRTAGYNIFPQYYYPGPCRGEVCPLDTQRPRIVGYQVRVSYEVKVRDIAKAGDVLSAMVGAGVNEVGNLEFTIDDPESLRADARERAVANARAKAEALAKNLGKRVGRITAFAEGGGGPPVIFAREALDGKGGFGGEGPAVPPGESEVVVTVSITYELR